MGFLLILIIDKQNWPTSCPHRKNSFIYAKPCWSIVVHQWNFEFNDHGKIKQKTCSKHMATLIRIVDKSTPLFWFSFNAYFIHSNTSSKQFSTFVWRVEAYYLTVICCACFSIECQFWKLVISNFLLDAWHVEVVKTIFLLPESPERWASPER